MSPFFQLRLFRALRAPNFNNSTFGRKNLCSTFNWIFLTGCLQTPILKAFPVHINGKLERPSTWAFSANPKNPPDELV